MRKARRPAPAVLLCAALFLAVAAPSLAQRGAITLPRNLAQLTNQSAVIVRGQIIGTRVEPLASYPSLWTVVVTLRVQDVLKGAPGQILTFRQFIWDARDRYDGAGYLRGQDIVMLLNPVTQLGLTSPAGLSQGVFHIGRNAKGELVAANGFGNAGLFRGVAGSASARPATVSPRLAGILAAPPTGPLKLDDLEALIRNFAEQD
ncbi:MAG: hypothetical protein WAL51_09310 [Candidatus Acidiferrales bacterium]